LPTLGFSWNSAAGSPSTDADLTPSLVDGNRNSVGQIQATAVLEHRQPKPAASANLFKNRSGQPGCFGTEDQIGAGWNAFFIEAAARFGGEGIEMLWHLPVPERLPVGMYPKAGELVVVESRSTHLCMVDRKAKRLNQMQ